MKKYFNLTLVVALGGFGAAALTLERERLEHVRECEELRNRLGEIAPAHAVSKEERRLDLQTKNEDEKLRGEVAKWERRAIERRAAMQAERSRQEAADAAAQAEDNRDPEKGMTKLEHFQNVGRASPSAALQTLVWAALKAEEETLMRGLAVEGRARERAEVIRKTLPEDRWATATPEKLAALWFESEVLSVASLHIADRTIEGDRASLIVRGGIARDRQMQFQLGPDGWQVVVPESAMESIQQKVLGASPALPKR